MPSSRNVTRQRLIQAAIALFATQGVTETTTKQIAELAQVNEVTLFRQFGNKHGLLLAAIEDAEVFAQWGQKLVDELPSASDLPEMLREYANTCLQALAHTPAVVRSLVGESGQYSIENRQALGRSFDRANRRVAKYLKTAIGDSQPDLQLPIEQLVSLLNTLLFGYTTIELTSEYHGLWRDRADFLDKVITLFLAGAIALPDRSCQPVRSVAADLPAATVHQILQQAKQAGQQTYAIVYVLFGAGVGDEELLRLEQANYHSTSDRQILEITTGLVRQVPVNRWIMGKSYGSYLKNPLTQWLRSRKDRHPALFVGADGTALTALELAQHWELATVNIPLAGSSLEIERSQSTWRIEMLMKGLTLADMEILTGLTASQLAPYQQRAQEQAAVLAALTLDTAKH